MGPRILATLATTKMAMKTLDELRESHPLLEAVDADGVDRTNWKQFLDRQVEAFGPTLSLEGDKL